MHCESVSNESFLEFHYNFHTLFPSLFLSPSHYLSTGKSEFFLFKQLSLIELLSAAHRPHAVHSHRVYSQYLSNITCWRQWPGQLGEAMASGQWEWLLAQTSASDFYARLANAQLWHLCCGQDREPLCTWQSAAGSRQQTASSRQEAAGEAKNEKLWALGPGWLTCQRRLSTQ